MKKTFTGLGPQELIIERKSLNDTLLLNLKPKFNIISHKALHNDFSKNASNGFTPINKMATRAKYNQATTKLAFHSKETSKDKLSII